MQRLRVIARSHVRGEASRRNDTRLVKAELNVLGEIFGDVPLAHHGSAHRDHVGCVVSYQPLSGAPQVASFDVTPELEPGSHGVHEGMDARSRDLSRASRYKFSI
jgi:hypothetical protein